MDYKLYDLHNPYTAFLVVATVIIILVRLFLKRSVILRKSTLISYIIYVAFTTFWYISISWYTEQETLTNLFETISYLLGPLLVIPGMLIYGLIPGVIKPCPSDTDVFGWFTFGFLFYAIVIWGIMKFRKIGKESKTAGKKQDDNAEKQTPTETEK
jgi:hypothetical protein